MPVELDLVAHILPLDLPGRAEGEPVLRVLHLVALLADLLLEDAVVVADAVARRGDVLRGERVQVARRESPQSAVAQGSVLLLSLTPLFIHHFSEDVLHGIPEIEQRLLVPVLDSQVDQRVLQRSSHQELQR